MLRVVGIVALFVLAACDSTSAKVGPSPSPVIVQGNWNQNLKLTGALPGKVTAIVPTQGTQQTFCSGSKELTGANWTHRFSTRCHPSSTDGKFISRVVHI